MTVNFDNKIQTVRALNAEEIKIDKYTLYVFLKQIVVTGEKTPHFPYLGSLLVMSDNTEQEEIFSKKFKKEATHYFIPPEVSTRLPELKAELDKLPEDYAFKGLSTN